MRNQIQDPSGELGNLERELSEQGRFVGAGYDPDSRMVNADKAVVRLVPTDGGPELKIRIEVTTNPDLVQRMVAAPEIDANVWDFTLTETPSGQVWQEEGVPVPLSSRDLAKRSIVALQGVLQAWDNNF